MCYDDWSSFLALLVPNDSCHLNLNSFLGFPSLNYFLLYPASVFSFQRRCGNVQFWWSEPYQYRGDEAASMLTANMTAPDAIIHGTHMSDEAELASSTSKAPATDAGCFLTHWDLFHTFRYVRRHVCQDTRGLSKRRRWRIGTLKGDEKGAEALLRSTLPQSELGGSRSGCILFPVGTSHTADWFECTWRLPTGSLIGGFACHLNSWRIKINVCLNCKTH